MISNLYLPLLYSPRSLKSVVFWYWVYFYLIYLKRLKSASLFQDENDLSCFQVLLVWDIKELSDGISKHYMKIAKTILCHHFNRRC